MSLTVRVFRHIFFSFCATFAASVAQAQQKTFTLDPAQTKFNFQSINAAYGPWRFSAKARQHTV